MFVEFQLDRLSPAVMQVAEIPLPPNHLFPARVNMAADSEFQNWSIELVNIRYR